MFTSLPISLLKLKTRHIILCLCNTCLPVQYLSLDGSSLTSTDLVNLGRGLYKIKVMINKLYLLSWLVWDNLWLNVIIPFSDIFSWLQRQRKKLCNPGNFWTPLLKKTEVKINCKSKTLNVHRSECQTTAAKLPSPGMNDFMFSPVCTSLCAASCLWNHNRFWQICPNCHSCQQTQVMTIFIINFFVNCQRRSHF